MDDFRQEEEANLFGIRMFWMWTIALVSLGLMTIPVTIIGDYVVRGYDEKKLREALEASRTPPG